MSEFYHCRLHGWMSPKGNPCPHCHPPKPLQDEIDRLRAELAKAKKEAGEYCQEVNTMHRCNDLNGMVHEAVMRVIRGEQVSDFEESFHDVREAIDKADQSITLAEEIAKLQTAKECMGIVDAFFMSGDIKGNKIAAAICEKYGVE